MPLSTSWNDRPFRQVWADTWDLANCHVHGVLKHLLVHEAGHTVVAARSGIEFVEVSISPHGKGPALAHGSIGGGLQLKNLPETWVPQRITEAFDLYLMGMYAEEKFLGHHLEGGWAEDLRQFRVASGFVEGVNPELANSMLKESFGRFQANWEQTFQDIDTVAQALMDKFDQSGARQMRDLDKPLVLTSQEVLDLLGLDLTDADEDAGE